MKYQKEDIYLRPLVREDALTSFRWRNDPEVWKYTGSRPDRIITPEIELNWIEQVLQNTSRRTFAICIAESDQYIGNVQITNICDTTGEFHIFIGDKSFWGKGIGTIAAEKILEIAKKELHLSKLNLQVNLKNTAAHKIYLKIGFTAIDDAGNMEINL